MLVYILIYVNSRVYLDIVLEVLNLYTYFIIIGKLNVQSSAELLKYLIEIYSSVVRHEL